MARSGRANTILKNVVPIFISCTFEVYGKIVVDEVTILKETRPVHRSE